MQERCRHLTAWVQTVTSDRRILPPWAGALDFPRLFPGGLEKSRDAILPLLQGKTSDPSTRSTPSTGFMFARENGAVGSFYQWSKIVHLVKLVKLENCKALLLL